MEHLSSLNEKQLEAVVATEGYLRVIAGAGSGKTKLLVSRYAYLVKDYGIDSANILCVTFTNKAAGEMKRRIRAIIGQEYDTSLICTYHGFCVRVLREDIEKIFYPKEFQIIDNSQQKALLSDIYQKFELKLDHASFEKIVKQIAYYKSKRSYIAKMCSRDNCQILESITTLDDKIIEEFLQRQRQLYAMDFNDLMYFTLDIFARCPEVLEKWQDRLNYIQVDEFQDSSSTEMELVDLLSGKHKNLMIVGDPDQNIYEWRGSDVKLLVDFDKEHIPTKTVFLNRNYRSTPQILKCANALIEKNVFRLKKELYTKSNDGFDVFHYHMKNEYAEAERIVERIHEIKKESGCNYADFAVLYRSGFLSRVIEKKFTENGVPYEIFGGVKFYLRMEIQDVMAYLRLA
ncbi:MAG: UvrD-helicase domain-containing protein, partial [Clostridia bacterium]|nr:UvrD-helicase domain-containing protein [Clostridia bacterium]